MPDLDPEVSALLIQRFEVYKWELLSQAKLEKDITKPFAEQLGPANKFSLQDYLESLKTLRHEIEKRIKLLESR